MDPGQQQGSLQLLAQPVMASSAKAGSGAVRSFPWGISAVSLLTVTLC
jgi:hypothetical protein